MLNKQSPITLSKTAITEMLSYYKQEQGWLYKGCTLDNIPWTFAYMTMACNVFGKKVPDKDLQLALIDRYPNIYFDENNYLCVEDHSEFISASFCFMHHKRILKEHDLEESLVFSVADDNQKPIYRKTIEFKHQYFCNLIAKKDSTYRDQSLIDLARKILTAT